MSFFSYALGALVLLFVLMRQARLVPVPRAFQPRLPVFLGVLGLFSIFAYSGAHHVPASTWGWVLASLAVGALGVGALRGISMRVMARNGWVVRQGTVATMALWVVSFVVHFAADARAGVAGLEGASFLLWLGLTLATQYYVVHRRAEPLYAQLGPDAGRPLRIDFSQGPGVFFTTFVTNPEGPPPGWGATPPTANRSRSSDADVIDVEVVDDDDRPPPELPAH